MEHVILFAGPMGAGKSTAIATLSDIEVVTTEAANTERHVVDKATTTVALDYGEITIGDEEKVRLYGVPGQSRFDFMWTILRERARGLVLLVNNDDVDPIASMLERLAPFEDLLRRRAVVIGVTRSDVAPRPSTADYAAAVSAAHPGVVLPILTVDARDLTRMRTLLLTLVSLVEAAAELETDEVTA